jgi:tRNA-uridine 2-sulfurtransferase
MARVVLAMSGGVDSSVAALLLREQGHEVIGLFMRTGAHSGHDGRADRKKGCCSAIDAGDARRVADRLDVPFYALDFERDFDRIIDYFADEYLNGRTPNPCVVCNSWLKFGQLWAYGKSLDADFIATGHYARRVREGGEAQLHRAIDEDKDQSYVLYGIRREVLPRLLFPLGEMRKEQVRSIAREAGLAVADKPDSVEICFVPDNDHARLIRERRPGASAPGAFVDESGHVLGRHDGIERYTVGQRKGLGIASAAPLYVVKLDAAGRRVVVGPREALRMDRIRLRDVNWIGDGALDRVIGAGIEMFVRVRSTRPPQPAWLRAVDGGYEVELVAGEEGVSPGQACVFYDAPSGQARVLGGGFIRSATARKTTARAEATAAPLAEVMRG